MSFFGTARLFSTKSPPRLVTLIPECLEATVCTRILCGSRRASAQEWTHLLRGTDYSPSFERLDPNLTPEQIAELCEPGTVVRLELITPLGKRVWDEIQEHIPPEVRGGASLSNVSLTIGEHDLFECLENEEGQYFGRATVSVTIDGPGCPEDWAEFRRLTKQLPAVRTLEQRLTDILGPVRCEVYWG